MKALLTLERIDKGKNCTFGRLLLDRDTFCFTLEDVDRGLDSSMPLWQIKLKKIFGITAIPSGVYPIVLEHSSRFDMVLPRIKEVKGFDGILIHMGNYAKDTLGCVLVGNYFIGDSIRESKKALDSLIKELKKYDEINIKILPVQST